MNLTQNRIAIITGVTRLKGVGKATCTELAEQGNDAFLSSEKADWISGQIIF